MRIPAPASSTPTISVNPPSTVLTCNTTMMITISGVGVLCGLNYHELADVCTAVTSMTATLSLLQARAEHLDRNLPVSPLQTASAPDQIRRRKTNLPNNYSTNNHQEAREQSHTRTQLCFGSPD